MLDYYNKCRCDIRIKSLHIKELTKIVEELGYSTNRKTKPYVWH
jgi:hypothetical protein